MSRYEKLKVDYEFSDCCEEFKGDDLSNFVQKNLNGGDYDRGALEEAQKTADNSVTMLGNLVSLLKKKNIIDDSDLRGLFEGITL